MARFRKKPVTVEAVPVHEVLSHIFGNAVPWPNWAQEALDRGSVAIHPDRSDRIEVYTLNGPVIADQDDWLIRGVEGELYPCKPSVFEATYEPADAEEAQGDIARIAGDVPPGGWEGTEPAEGTRRRLILDMLVARFEDCHRLTLIEVADEIEIALQRSDGQPSLADRLGDSPAQRAMDARDEGRH